MAGQDASMKHALHVISTWDFALHGSIYPHRFFLNHNFLWVLGYVLIDLYHDGIWIWLFLFYKLKTRGLFLKDTKATARWVRKPRRPTTAAAWWRRCMEKVTETEDAALEATTDSVRDKTRLFRCGSAEGIWTRSGPRSKKWKLVFFFLKRCCSRFA